MPKAQDSIYECHSIIYVHHDINISITMLASLQYIKYTPFFIKRRASVCKRNYYNVNHLKDSHSCKKRTFLTLTKDNVNNNNGGNDKARTRYRETRVVPFTPEHAYSVVSDVRQYNKFVPWCIGSKIVKGPIEFKSNNGTKLKHIKLDAELSIGFNFVSEKYISHVLMHPNKSIRAVSRDTTIFEALLTEWKFKPGDQPNTCEINFFIDFKFSNALYAQVSTIFFDEVVKEMVSAFEKRCEQVGG